MTRARRVVVAPGAFKGSLAAHAVADAIADGVQAAWPDAVVVRRPLADGGDGTAAAVAEALAARPLAGAWRLPGGGTVLVESAASCGLARLEPPQRDPEQLDTAALAMAVRQATAGGARNVILAVGGTATVDGGTGLLRAFGARLLDGAGAEIADPNPVLAGVAKIELDGLDPEMARLRWRCWLDVDAPLLGERGAARAFGPQKGASPGLVERLEEGMERLAGALADATGRDPRRGPPGLGAGGGIPAALWSVFGAACEPGAETVIRTVGLRCALQGADLLITGEGELDATSLQGKAPAVAARAAAAMGVPRLWVVGRVAPGTVPPSGGRVVAAAPPARPADPERLRNAVREALEAVPDPR